MKQYLPILIFFALIFTSCRSVTEVAYISDAQRDSAQAIVTTYQSTIRPGDLLYIYIYSQTPESVIPFNQESRIFAAGSAYSPLAKNQATKNEYNGYLVDEEGFIIMPILNKLAVAGLSWDSLQSKIEYLLKDGGYVNDAVVTVSAMNFRVAMIGEVVKPQELHVSGDRLTILEAIALCGDLTMYAQRDNVLVLRTQNGELTPIEVDLTKKTLFDSRGYYLQTNDIVYVEPSRLRKKRAMRNETWPQDVSLGISAIALARHLERVINRTSKIR